MGKITTMIWANSSLPAQKVISIRVFIIKFHLQLLPRSFMNDKLLKTNINAITISHLKWLCTDRLRIAQNYLINFIPARIQSFFDGFCFELLVSDPQHSIWIWLALYKSHHVCVLCYKIPGLQNMDPYNTLKMFTWCNLFCILKTESFLTDFSNGNQLFPVLLEEEETSFGQPWLDQSKGCTCDWAEPWERRWYPQWLILTYD